MDEHGRIKLCDFGISGRLVDSKAKTRSAGCAAYMAVSGLTLKIDRGRLAELYLTFGSTQVLQGSEVVK